MAGVLTTTTMTRLVSIVIGLVVGLFAAAIASRSMDMTALQGQRETSLGCFGHAFAGVVGALLGQWILDSLFNIQADDYLWLAITAFIGATVLIAIAGRLFSRRQTPRQS